MLIRVDKDRSPSTMPERCLLLRQTWWSFSNKGDRKEERNWERDEIGLGFYFG